MRYAADGMWGSYGGQVICLSHIYGEIEQIILLSAFAQIWS